MSSSITIQEANLSGKIKSEVNLKGSIRQSSDLRGIIAATDVVRVWREDETFILVDVDGNEVTAVVSDEPVILDATPSDIRVGKTAATYTGVTVGEREFTSHRVTEGRIHILRGEPVRITGLEDCDYTELQAIVCKFNTTFEDSVSAEMVCIDDALYSVNSDIPLSKVTVNKETKTIDFGVVNDSNHDLLLRYFLYKEI